MARITHASAKARGRNLQKWVCRKLSDLMGIPWGKDELIASREGAAAGTDVRLIGEALTRFPFSVECKNVELWSVPKWIVQAKANQIDGTDWVLIAKRNDTKPVAIMDAETFFRMAVSTDEG